jgi:outer membrane protein OmpA-like peptidoglycan-associated protein
MVIALAAVVAGTAQPLAPLETGLIITSALHSERGDRENVVVISQADAAGVSYAWRARQRDARGQVTEANFFRFVRAIDLASATRLNTVFRSEDRTQYPGYTAFSISTAVYDALLAAGSAAFTVVSLDRGQGGLQTVLDGFAPVTFKLKGVLTRQGQTTFPLLVNGRRVHAPAWRTHGSFASQDRRVEQEFVLLADRAHPLVLKVVTGTDVYQVIRIDKLVTRDPPRGEVPKEPGQVGGDTILPLTNTVESELLEDCRAEVPGIYFDFALATLNDQSLDALAALADIIARHADWKLSIEGHTDDIGSDPDNLQLSQARAQAVVSSLTQRHHLDGARLTAKGFGESRPRESNTTLEGRARNRRVEIVRPCSKP